MQPRSPIRSCVTTQHFTHESSPHYNTGCNLHGIKSSKEIIAVTSSPNHNLNLNALAAGLVRTFAWAGCLPVALGPAFSEASVLRTPCRLRGSCLRVDLSPAYSPPAKTGTLLIHRQQEVNLQECTKLISSNCV